MWNQPINFSRLTPYHLTDFLGNISQNPYGKLENRLSVHAQEWITGHLPTGNLTRNVQNAILASIGMHCRCQNTRLIRSLQNNRASPVAEQYACTSIVPVENTRKNFGANYQCFFMAT